MANLIARLGLDSTAFKADIASAKASVGGFQGTIKSATNSMRNMFDTVLKPIAVVTAAIYAVHRIVGGLNEIMTATADKMRNMNGEEIVSGMENQKEAVSELAREYRNATEEQSAYAASESKTLKAAEASAMATLKLRKSLALLADEKSGGKNRDKIELAFSKEETRLKSGGEQWDLGNQQTNMRAELDAKKQMAEDLRRQAQDADAIRAKALSEAEALREEKRNLEAPFAGLGEGEKKAREALIGDVHQKELDKRIAAEKKASDAAKQALEMSRNLNDEALKLEREYTYGSIALKELRGKAEDDLVNATADQLDKNASRLSALNAVKGQGVNPDSMARIGGFMGGERPGLAVADKQLQVSKEMLTIQKENKVLLQAVADLMARDRIGTGGDL